MASDARPGQGERPLEVWARCDAATGVAPHPTRRAYGIGSRGDKAGVDNRSGVGARPSGGVTAAGREE